MRYIFNYTTIFTTFILLFLVACSHEDEGDDTSRNNNDDDEEQTQDDSGIWYVSPDGEGEKSGKTADDAADFLDDKFWDDVRKEILKDSLSIQFLDGEYGRAYTEKALVLEKIGHPDHKLRIKGGSDVVFTLDEGEDTKSYVISVRGARNIVIDGLNFTGDGSVNYVLRFNKLSSGVATKDITLKNSSFKDMEGIIYGASGCAYEETSHITYENNTFKRIGEASTAHMIYNAYGSDHIHIVDNYFEDCRGDYVRFRDDSDYGVVKGNTFLKKSKEFSGNAFISMPLFNSREPVGDEYFATNYAFSDNDFINESSAEIEFAIKFHQSGFSPPEWNYLLTKEEGDILMTGTDEEKKELLLENFDIDPDKIRVSKNEFSSQINYKFALTTIPQYGAESKGFSGDGDIFGTINKQEESFDWEP